MSNHAPFEELLAGGDRRSLAQANEAARRAVTDRAAFRELAELMWSPDAA